MDPQHCEATMEARWPRRTLRCTKEQGHEGLHEAWSLGYAQIWGDDGPETVPAAVRDAHAAWAKALGELSPLREDVGDKFAAVDREYARRMALVELVESNGLTGSRWDPRSPVDE